MPWCSFSVAHSSFVRLFYRDKEGDVFVFPNLASLLVDTNGREEVTGSVTTGAFGTYYW